MESEAKKSSGLKLTGVSYDADTWTLHATVNGTSYEYRDMSPFHCSQFFKRARYNAGRAVAYLRKSRFPCYRWTPDGCTQVK